MLFISYISYFLCKSNFILFLNWLFTMNENQLNGVLADEMGLGKTIQKTHFRFELFYKEIHYFVL